MPKYLLSVWHDEDYVVDFSGEDMQRIGAQVGAFNDELTSAGAWVFGDGLEPRSTASVAKPSGPDGKVELTDGPYAEGKEHIGGFWVIEAADREAALEWTRKAAAACEGPVECRPFQVEG